MRRMGVGGAGVGHAPFASRVIALCGLSAAVTRAGPERRRRHGRGGRLRSVRGGTGGHRGGGGGKVRARRPGGPAPGERWEGPLERRAGRGAGLGSAGAAGLPRSGRGGRRRCGAAGGDKAAPPGAGCAVRLRVRCGRNRGSADVRALMPPLGTPPGSSETGRCRSGAASALLRGSARVVPGVGERL